MELTDDVLIEAFRNGNEFAFVALYNRYKRVVYAFAVKMVFDTECAKDILQGVFLKVYERRMQLKNPDKFRSWIFAICRNDCLSHLKESKRVASLDNEPFEIDATTPHTLLNRAEDTLLVGRAVGRLNPELREVIILRAYEGLSYREIADVTGSTEVLVKSRLFSARKKLYQLLTPFFKERIVS